MDPTNLSNFDNPPQQGNLISNCAMGMINADKPFSFDGNDEEVSALSDLSIFCVACKDGYRPVYNPRFPLHVYECV